MVGGRLKPLGLYLAELFAFIILIAIVITLVSGTRDILSVPIIFPISFGCIRSLIVEEKSFSRLFLRNLTTVLILYLVSLLPSVTSEITGLSGFLASYSNNLITVDSEFQIFVSGLMTLLCCGNLIGKTIRSRSKSIRERLSSDAKASSYAYDRLSDEVPDKNKILESNASFEPSDIDASEEPEINLQPPVNPAASDAMKIRGKQKSPEERARDLELHRTRIELIGGYLTAFQPLFVFLAAVIGSVLMYLGSR